MNIDISEYYTTEEWEKFKSAADKYETPFLLVNTDIVERNYKDLQTFFPYAKTYYAVKANPDKEVLNKLNNLGSNFDIASIYELDKVLAIGVKPERLSYGNTIKKPNHIEYAYNKGVRLFATDSEMDLRNIAKTAPGSKIFCRILTEGAETADWPLSRKFGCQPDMSIDLLILAKKLGLVPYGVSFHVGSQQRDIGTWDSAIAKVKYIYDWMSSNEDVRLKMINMGGGLPAPYLSKTNDLQIYADEITRYLHDDFGDELPEVILEPGRSMVGNCGILVSEIVLISRKSRTALDRWVYLDVGKFNGLIETLEECIKYPLYCEKKGVCEESVIAGPTCDSQDVMYEYAQYSLPLSLAVGDRIYWLTTGAYTSSYCSVEFNGFPPLKTYHV
ncbi:MAG TPA: ornithine decarboxylase [Lentisphaeria bacterium]|nr:MAG: ornithine decarboxylase [Lentisphaerae bacterium GWF2_38_69]HBM16263.1 ornithine decarboxylase [Lentisphaeria bacterium]